MYKDIHGNIVQSGEKGKKNAHHQGNDGVNYSIFTAYDVL